jgi:hypothetical protein
MGTSYSTYQAAYDAFQQKCSSGTWDASTMATGLFCEKTLLAAGGINRDYIHAVNFNDARMKVYSSCMDRMNSTCGKYAEDAVPAMYYDYNSSGGRANVEGWIAARPDAPAACKDLLRNNYLNPQMKCWNRPLTIKLLGNLDVPTQDYRLEEGLPDKTATVIGNQTTPAWGNPLWDDKDRLAASIKLNSVLDASGQVVGNSYTEILTNSIQYGRAAEGTQLVDYFQEGNYTAGGALITDPGYKGKLPNLPQPAAGGNIPWAPSLETGGAGSQYINPCSARGPLETIFPIAASIFGIAVPLILIPGIGIAPIEDLGTWTAAGTAGGALYYVARDMYGIDALFGWNDENGKGPQYYAARILSLGAPATAWLLADTVGALSSLGSGSTFRYGGAAAAAGLGFVLLPSILEPALGIGGGLFSIVTAPIALIETGVTLLFNGCVAEVFNGINQCRCAYAYKKSQLQRDWAVMYGITDDQKRLRTACAKAAMTTGMWGTSQEVTGSCDLSTGVMNNMEACLAPVLWLYRKDQTPNQSAFWGEVAHCYDPANPSFLAPKTEADKACQSKYGEYFRDVAGECRNMAAPNGKQGPDAYDFQAILSGDQGWCNIL